MQRALFHNTASPRGEVSTGLEQVLLKSGKQSGKQTGKQPTLQARKRQYKVDLANLHALCEANYARLLRLFPDYEQANTRLST